MMGSAGPSQPNESRALDIEKFTTTQLESLLLSQGKKFREHNGDREGIIGAARKVEIPLSMMLVRSDLKELMISNQAFDDGSYAPLFIRFAWHNSGTFDKNKRNGGSNGGTMRFEKEREDPENAGLARCQDLLKPIKEKYSFMSHADLYILAGCVAIESTGGPYIPFSYGRLDYTEVVR